MKLQEIKSLSGFLHLERYVNDPKYSATAQYSEVEDVYHPRFGQASFLIPYYQFPKSELEILTAKNLRPAESAKFFAHPSMENEIYELTGKKPSGRLRAAPTSSTRTLILLEENPGLMVKTHLNKRISRFIRRLRADSVRHSVLVSEELEKLTADPKMPADFGFLPESTGLIHKASGIGCIMRESEAFPKTPGQKHLIPLFALYSKDQKNPLDAPPLIQIAKQLNADPYSLLINSVILPLIRGWAFVYLNYGLLLEAHGQNTLLEIDKNFRPTKIVHRDFQSTPIDPQIRSENRLPAMATAPFTKHLIGSGDYPNLLEQGLMYDHFIGDYLLKFFEQFAEEYLDKSPDEFRASVQTIFREYVPNPEKYFPKGHVVFKKNVLAEDNTYELMEIPEKPIYR